MKNPLSYQHGVFTGKEINDWCKSHLYKGTSAAREARRLLRKKYKDDRCYKTYYCSKNSGSGSGQIICFKRISEEQIHQTGG